MDWKFNPAYASWHAATSLSPKSRLNIQLSCYLTCRLDSVSFLPEERIENPELFCQSTRTQHFVSFSWWVSCNSSFATRYVDSVSLSPKSGIFDMPTRQHFLFLTEEGIGKIQTSSASQCIWHFGSFSSRVNWKFSSSFTSRYVDRCFICLKSGLKSSFTGFFALRYVDRLLFPQSGWKKNPALHNFSVIRNEDSVYFFCDPTRLFMWSVPCLWFSHFVPCALVCVSNPVPKGIFILFCRLTFKQEVLHA